MIVTALAAIFIASVLAKPVLPGFNLKALKPKAPNIPANPTERKARKAQADLQRALAKTSYVVPGKRRSRIAIVPPPPSIPAPVVPTTRPLSVGFFVNWDESYEISWNGGAPINSCTLGPGGLVPFAGTFTLRVKNP